MGISIYSVVISIVFFNIALIATFIMRRSNALLAKRTVSFLLLTVLLGVVRLLTPIDFDKAVVVRSYHVIPTIEDFLNLTLVGPFTTGSVLLVVWFLGTLAFIVYDVVLQFRFVQASRNYPVSDRKDVLDLAGEFGTGFSIMVSPLISRPYVSGLLRPVIYLPDLELSEVQWRTILRHEVQHIHSHDEWKKLFFLASQALFWWNPLAHISRKEIDTLIELQCDAKVTARMSDEEVDAYLETLKTLSIKAHELQIPLGASALVGDEEQLVARFRALQDSGFPRKNTIHTIAYLMLFTLFVLSYFVIVQPAGFASDADLTGDLPESSEYYMYAAIENNSDMYIVRSNDTYYLYLDGVQINSIEADMLSEPPYNSLQILEDDK